MESSDYFPSLFADNRSNTSLLDLIGPKRDNLTVVIPVTAVYVLIFFTGLVGNVSTCVVIARNKSMHTATNYYLFSLAISDLLLLISGLPQEVYSIWSRYPYVFGNMFCVLRGLFAEASANATVLTITAFTVERYLAICHPFLSHTMSKLSRAIKYILSIWVFAVFSAVPQALQFGVSDLIPGVSETETCQVTRIIIPHSFEVSTFMFFVAPMSLITVLYVLIGLRLKSSSKIKKSSGDSNRSTKSTTIKTSLKSKHSQSSRRVLKMLGGLQLKNKRSRYTYIRSTFERAASKCTGSRTTNNSSVHYELLLLAVITTAIIITQIPRKEFTVHNS